MMQHTATTLVGVKEGRQIKLGIGTITRQGKENLLNSQARVTEYPRNPWHVQFLMHQNEIYGHRWNPSHSVLMTTEYCFQLSDSLTMQAPDISSSTSTILGPHFLSCMYSVPTPWIHHASISREMHATFFTVSVHSQIKKTSQE